MAEQLRVDQCYCVQNHNLDDQVQEVLNYFKIVVKKEDLNSRCQVNIHICLIYGIKYTILISSPIDIILVLINNYKL